MNTDVVLAKTAAIRIEVIHQRINWSKLRKKNFVYIWKDNSLYKDKQS